MITGSSITGIFNALAMFAGFVYTCSFARHQQLCLCRVFLLLYGTDITHYMLNDKLFQVSISTQKRHSYTGNLTS